MRTRTIIIILSLITSAFAINQSRPSVAADGIPKGWFGSGTDPKSYEITVDTAVKHSGKASAHIRFIGDKAEGFGTLMQVFKADAFRGKRVRLSAWMKSETADSAELWFRLDGPKGMLGFDNMGNRPVKGTTDWEKYELILDVPDATVDVAFGAFVAGKGQAWLDDFEFEVVGVNVASTNMLSPDQMREEHEAGPAHEFPNQPANLNFEEGVLTPEETSARLAREKADADAFSVWLAANAIKLDTVQAGHGFADMQPLKKVVGDARIVALGEATHGTREFFQLKHRMMEFLANEKGFTVFSIEANMPEAYRLNDFVLNGKGDPAKLIRGMYFWTWDTQEVLDMVLWMREFNKSGKGPVQFTGFDMQTPNVAAGIVSDFVARLDPNYSASLIKYIEQTRRSSASGSMTAGGATATFPLKLAAGKKLRVNAHVKTEAVTRGFASPWVRVDGPAGVVGFDSMQKSGGFTGTADWKNCELEVPVNLDDAKIVFGVFLQGNGTAWFDSLSFELDGKPYDPGAAVFDLDFETPAPKGFSTYTSGNEFQVQMDGAVSHTGKQSLRISNTGAVSKEARPEDPKLASANWQEVVQHLEKSRDAYAKQGASAREIEWVIQNARVVLQSIQMGSNEISRDQSMADNIKWILDQNPGAKIVLWAHNGHVATAGKDGYEPMGVSLRKMYGDNMVVFGFAFNQGSFQAVEQGIGLHDFTVPPAPAGSLDATFAATGIPLFAVDLRAAPKSGPVANWLGESHKTRSIGALFSPDADAQYQIDLQASQSFDVMLFVEKTTAARKNP